MKQQDKQKENSCFIFGAMNFGDHLFRFYAGLQPPEPLPNGIEWLHPQEDAQVLEVVRAFCSKYFNDTKIRTLMLGINPGRFGAGVTGVNFTAPKQLTQACGIDHPFKMHTELSADFIYDMIAAFGGPASFYKRIFIGSVCPLGFVKNGRNINYYDDRDLLQFVEPFIIQTLEQQLEMGLNRKTLVCIGGEKNFKYLDRLNSRRQWFREVVSVPHPRFIMQYRRPHKEQFIRQYLQIINEAMG